MNITAADRSALLRLASTLPKGDETRRAILSAVKRAAPSVTKDDVDSARTLSGVDPQIAKFLVDSGLDDGDRRGRF